MNSPDFHQYCFIERLTFPAWVTVAGPYAFKNQRAGRTCRILFVEATFWGRWIARVSGLPVEKFNFKLAEIKDEQGVLCWYKLLFEELVSELNKIKDTDLFQEVCRYYRENIHLQTYLFKRILRGGAQDSLLRILYLLYVISDYLDKKGDAEAEVVFFIQDRPWLEQVKAAASRRGIRIAAAPRSFCFSLLSGRMRHHLKRIIYHYRMLRYRLKSRLRRPADENELRRFYSAFFDAQRSGAPRLAVEYYGHFNLDRPDLFSDVFFIDPAGVKAHDVLLTFSLPQDPCDDDKVRQMSRKGISAVSLNSRAAATPYVPLFDYYPSAKISENSFSFALSKNRVNAGWFKEQLADYQQQFDLWCKFFQRYNVKVFLSWMKYDERHCAWLDALKANGGIGVIYQRSMEDLQTPWCVTSADVVFGFSASGIRPEDGNSRIPYYVVTGYLGDYRFNLLRPYAQSIRLDLQKKGAKRILAYFDENSKSDERWSLGSEASRQNYQYLLNKVLSEPDLGLVLKPKVPSTLLKRLGPVSSLLREAEKTGRCFIFWQGEIQGSYPPCAASLAADIAVHSNLSAASAGMEAALAGTPAVMLDMEGCPKSLLHQLPEDTVVFKNWNDLWRACEDFWRSGKNTTRLGDWSPILDQLDPFRDGRAVLRMSSYLNWLLEGFKSNLPRETILADAAERYGRMWGKDKVFSFNVENSAQAAVTV